MRNLSNASLRSQIKVYHQIAAEMKAVLDKHPHEWGKFQNEFNKAVNDVFRELMDFEKENMAAKNEEKVYKLKNFFIKYLRKEFLYGQYILHSLSKPYGYAGDFEIIDHIYRNEPKTLGFERLYDNYFQMSTITSAVRNRKQDFKRIVLKKIQENPDKKLRVLDIGAGPGRLCLEILEETPFPVDFYCMDNDPVAIKYAKSLLAKYQEVHYIQENAVRLALKKDIREIFPDPFDMIYSTGLFDYFDDRVTVRLLKNLKLTLAPEGTLAISDVRDKYSNPSLYYMEWVADWNLIYREDKRFRQLFLEVGFKQEKLCIDFEQQGVLQYIWANQE